MNFKSTQSKWIWNGDSGVNQYLCFRKEFVTSADRAEIYISCDTSYSLFFNGEWVNFGQYSAYPENKHYDLLDLTKHLKPGRNVLAILVYYQGITSFSYSVGKPGLFYAIKTPEGFISNEGTYAKKASGFKSGEIDLISSQLGPTFSFDARCDENFASYDYFMDETWELATECEPSLCFPYEMKKRPVEKLILDKIQAKVHIGGEFSYRAFDASLAEKMQNAFLRKDEGFYKEENGEIKILKDNSFLILDLGAETAGYFYLDITAPAGVKLDVSYGEHLYDLRVRSFDNDGNKFAFDYVTKSCRQNFSCFFRRLGGRYIQINLSGVSAPVVIHSIGFYHAIYPVQNKKYLTLTDALDKKIYETCIKTLRECMHESYEDTPWREQGLYGFDSRNQGLFGYSVFKNGNFKFVKASLRLLGDSLGDDGMLSITALTDTKNFKIPSFTLHWVTFVSEYVSYSADARFAKEILPKIKKVFGEYFKGYDGTPLKRKKGEEYWNFYDWKGILAGEHFCDHFTAETDSLCNLLLAFAMKKAKAIANCAKDFEYVKSLEDMFERLRKTINTYFYDERTGLYKTLIDSDHTSQLAQALAVLTGIAISPQKCEAALLSPPDDMEKVALSTSQFKYEVLLKNKKNHLFVLDEVRRIWGNMLYDGATTFYETEEGVKDVLAGSLCHGWSAVPIYVYEKIFGSYYTEN